MVNKTEPIDLINNKETVVFEATHTVIQETNLNDSLSMKLKTYRALQKNEKVKLLNTSRSNDLGGSIWVRIKTEKRGRLLSV
jgi:hypothetical protein